MNSVLITGAAGFIGAATTRRLINNKIFPLGIDPAIGRVKVGRINQLRAEACYATKDRVSFSSNESESVFKFYDWALSSKDDWTFQFNIFDKNKFDAVIHLGAVPGVRDSITNPSLYYKNNLMGTVQLLELMKKNRINKLVFASTSSVYDWANAPYWATSERTSYIKARHPYAGSKLAAEELCRIYHEQFGMDITILRYFTVYGPSGRPDMFPLRVIRAITEGLPIKLNGDGKQNRDFTYIDDVVDANIRALDLTGFQILNIGSGMPYDLITFIEEAEIAIGKKAIIEHQEPSPLDIPFTWADYSEAEKLMGWRPETGIVNGIRYTAKWYNENREALKDVEF